MRAYLEAARKNRKLQRIASAVAVFAAVFVVCGVFWALKDTGIAMTGDPACGFVEHTHTDACYAKTLTCGLEESEGHAHSVANGCYAASASASLQAQAPGGKAAASVTTSEAASASASSQSQSQLQAQAAAAPAQSQSTQTLTCDKQETPAHTHSEACYEKNLTCTVPEHTHSKSCYENAEADVETAQDWEATLPASLTGKWPSDAVAVAQSQLGYAESQSNRAAGEDGAPQGYTRYGAWSGSPYAKWSAPFAAFCLHYAKTDGYPTGSTAAEWANALQSQECRLYHPAEGNYEPKPGDLVFLAAEKDAEKVANARTQAADALAQAQAGEGEGEAAEAVAQGEAAAAQAAEAAEAEAQAQVESAYDGVAALADGMAVVEEVLPADQNNPARIRVIQGDSEDATQHVSKVQRVDYPRADARILGYAELPENSQALQEKKEAARQAASEAEAQDVTESQDEGQITQTFEGEGYTVKATYGPEAQLPENVQLVVRELTGDEYNESLQKAQEAVGTGELGFARFFDVSFMVNGEKVEPAAPVDVKITYSNAEIPEGQVSSAVHFAESGTEVLDATLEQKDSSATFEFTQSSFSVTGIVTRAVQKPETITTIDNQAVGITMNLFDYDADDNGSNVLERPTYTGINNISHRQSHNSTNELLFLGQSNQYSQGINNFAGQNAMQGIVDPMLKDGFPTLETDQSSLDYLFNSTAYPSAKTVYSNVNHLLSYNSNEESYQYDSNAHYAEFDSNTGNFTVYNGTYKQKNDPNRPIGFFPFNKYGAVHNISKGEGMDHFFGMTMEADFKIPKNTKVKDKDMVFEFSGDDDVWVFIDDVLVLDIGGIHRAVGGSINFTTGEVKVDSEEETTCSNGNTINAKGKTAKISDIFTDAGKTYNGAEGSSHTIKFFYLERGSGESNCMLKFNLPVYNASNPDPGSGDAGTTLDVHKTIDAFCDGADNPDTDLDNKEDVNKTDLYRLYLDAAVEREQNGVDLLIVVDESDSMTTRDMTTQNEDGTTSTVSREEAIRKILNGAAEFKDYQANKTKGLIYKFLEMNPQNQVAIVGFYGSSCGRTGFESNQYFGNDAKDILGENGAKSWRSGVDNVGFVNIATPREPSAPVGGQRTNYCAGLRMAQEVFAKVKDDGRKKIMLFLSDGVPTFYMTGDNDRQGNGMPTKEYLFGQLVKDNPKECSDGTISYFDRQFYPTHTNVTVCTVGIFPGSGDGDDYSTSETVLRHMATKGSGQFVSASDADTVQNAMWQFMNSFAATNLKIEDTLSAYVNLHGQPDFKVTMSKSEDDGTKTEKTLYEGGSITEDGQGKLAGVTYDSETKKVVAEFSPDYLVESGWKYTLSFNVEASYKAYVDHEKDVSYAGVTGDSYTDYAENKTSSEEPGFYSNYLASASYTSGGTTYSKEYQHPVIQVNGKKPAAPNTDGTLSWNKTIDAFRDGADNPDTTLDDDPNIDKTDLYRLNLTAELKGNVEPIDLLIVVDQSGSMHNDYSPKDKPGDMTDTTYKGTADEAKTIYRDSALQLILNGCYNDDPRMTTSAPSDYDIRKKDGLIYQFLNANPKNKVAIVGFQGDSYANGERMYGESYKFSDAAVTDSTLDEVRAEKPATGHPDAETLLPWTTDGAANAKFVNVTGYKGNATNYHAGFIQMQRLLDKVADDGNKKVVLFLSDGQPTCYIAKHEPDFYDRDRYYYRQGTGYDESQGTEAATDQAYSDFVSNYVDKGVQAVVSTVSICPPAEDSSTDQTTRLTKMKDLGKGNFYQADSTAELTQALKKAMFGTLYSDLVIEDTLSEYVDYYDDKPDLKVVMTDAEGKKTTLYENDQIRDAGKGILNSVDYDSQTKKIKAIFDQKYEPKPGTSFALSFNVKTTDKAYQDYAAADCKYLVNGNSVTGDEGTDYAGNSTSAGKGGFHSNAEATLKYKKNDGQPKTVEYRHPVVQVASCDFVLEKTDETAEKSLAGAAFELYRKLPEGETGGGISVGTLNGTYSKVGDVRTTLADGQLKYEGLVPGDYCLVETKAPDGYKLLAEPIAFTLNRSTDSRGQIVGSSEAGSVEFGKGKDVLIGDLTVGSEKYTVLKVKNETGYELPQTGGGGFGTLFGAGAVLVACAGAGLAAKRRRGARA